MLPTLAIGTPPTIEHFTATLSDVNLITLDWEVTGGNSENAVYIWDDIGLQEQSCRTEPPGCSTTVRIGNGLFGTAEGGVYRYTLTAANDENEFAKQRVEVTVPSPDAPTTETANVDVDALDVQSQTIWWSHAANAAGFVRVFAPGSAFTPLATDLDTTGTLPIDAADLQVGRNEYKIQYCERPSTLCTAQRAGEACLSPTVSCGTEEPCGTPALCSRAVPFVFNVRATKFDGDYREFAPADEPLTLTWNGSGNQWFLEAPSLGIATWLSQPTYTVPVNQLTEGVHGFKVTNCVFGVKCSNRGDIYAPQAGTVTFYFGFDPVKRGDVVGAVESGSGSEDLIAPRSGIFFPLVAQNSSTTSGANVAAVISEDKDFKQVVVGQTASVASWSTEDWSTTFSATSFDTKGRATTGSPLDITFDGSGDLWQVGEFGSGDWGSGIAHVSGNTLTHYDVPTARVFEPDLFGHYLLRRVKPFRSVLPKLLSGDPNAPGDVSYSELAERVIDTGDAIWFTQGGGLFSSEAGNYSRLVRFDRSGFDAAEFPEEDDRMCAIHVPGDNAEIVGVTWDGERIWFIETGRQILGWLDPATFSWPCDNFLDYGNGDAVAAAEIANLCTSETQGGCIHEIALPETALFAHLIADLQDGYLWFPSIASLGSSNVLGRYPLTGGSVETFPLPLSFATLQASPTQDPPFDLSLLHGFPWQIRVDDDAVYLNEYVDNDLIRFDKDGTGCDELVDGHNPCMTEIHLPIGTRDVNAHSIALDGDHLWFTLANEAVGPLDRDASTFGYVDVTSWASGTPTGVLYSDLDTLGNVSEGRYHSFRGIDVSTAGNVALADMRTEAIIRLDPLP